MDKMKWINIALGLLLFLTVACQNEEIISGGGTEDVTGVELAIAVGDDFQANSRSAITSSEYVQHIEYMYAYVFSGTESTATCVYEQKLPWVPVESMKEPFKCQLKISDEVKETYLKGDYHILVIGVDNNKDTYHFPFAEAGAGEDIHLGFVEKKATYADVKISLAKAESANWMAYTELFSGITVANTRQVQVEVTLNRCIAGVLCYVKDIPAKKNGYEIVGLELALANSTFLNDRLSNPKLETVTDPASPGTTKQLVRWTATNNDVCKTDILVSCDLLDEWQAQQPDISSDKETLYIPARNEGSFCTVEGSVLMGAYLLPVDNTRLVLYLKGRKKNADGSYTAPERLESSGDYYLINNEEGKDIYPLSVNHIYCIGSKPFSATTDNDQPASLAGGGLIVKAEPWTDIEDNIDFPNYSLTVRLDGFADNKDRFFNEDKYIFNCIGSDSLYVYVGDDKGNRGWTLSAKSGPEYEGDWIFFEDPMDKQWKKAVSGVGTTKVRVLMNDYVVKREWKPTDADYIERVAKDIRTADIELRTVGLGNLPVKIGVRQFNALTVKANRDNGIEGDRAFSRLDYGVFFNPETGEPIREKIDKVTHIEWGWHSSTLDEWIYGSDRYKKDADGEYTVLKSYNYHRNRGDFDKTHKGSILYKPLKDALEYRLSSDQLIANNAVKPYGDNIKPTDPVSRKHVWFPPTYSELYAYLKTVSIYAEDMRVYFNYGKDDKDYDNFYWTTETKDNTTNSYAIVAIKESTGSDYTNYYTKIHKREDLRRVLQARKFDVIE